MPTFTETQGQIGSFPTFEEMLGRAGAMIPQSPTVVNQAPVMVPQLPALAAPPRVAQPSVSDSPPPFEPRFTKSQFSRMTPQQRAQVASVEEPRYRAYQQAVQQWRFNQQAQKLATMREDKENVQAIGPVGDALEKTVKAMEGHPGSPVHYDKGLADVRKAFTRATDLVSVDRTGLYLPLQSVTQSGHKDKLNAISKADELNDKMEKLESDRKEYSILLKDQYRHEEVASKYGYKVMPGGLTNAAAGNAFMFRKPPATNSTGRVAAPQSAGLNDMMEMLRKQGVPEADIKALQQRWVK